MEVRVKGIRIRRLAAVLGTASIALTVLVAPVSAARSTSKLILVGSSLGSGVNDPGPTATGAAQLTFTPVSAGNLSLFDVVVKNGGTQNINNVQLSVGYDSVDTVESARPVTSALTPAFPIAFPAGTVTIASFTGAGCSLDAPDVGPISCTIGTLAKGASFRLEVVLATSVAGTVPVKAVSKVSENTNDNGSNQDTFAAEGNLVVTPFSCDSTSAYLPGNAGTKTIGTCPVGDAANANQQAFSVQFPARLSTVTLNESTATLCPVATGCFGATFEADIVGDATSDIVTWTVTIDLTSVGRTNLNLNKLVVYHYNDAGVLSPTDGIANTKKNECKNAGQANCIVSASITSDILTVVFQTDGNGSTRLLG
jgi:hypothetical protein